MKKGITNENKQNIIQGLLMLMAIVLFSLLVLTF